MKVLLATLTLLLIGGCVNAPKADYYETSYFELVPAMPERMADQPRFDAPIRVEPFSSFASTGLKMASRDGQFQVRNDEYNRWSAAPEKMLTGYWYEALKSSALWPRVFGPYDDAAPYLLSGRLMTFERSGRQATCRLELVLEDRRDGNILLEKSYTATEELTKIDGAAYADAMSRAAATIARQALEDMRNLAP